jgi:DNA-binding SARP family transcriptional activator
MSPENALDGPAVRLRLVGEFTVLRDGLRVDVGELGSRKARTLLKLLAVERGRLVPTDRIVDVLWGDQPPAQPSENVATLVSRLRKTLGAAVVVGGRSGYRLADPPAAVVDVDDGGDLVIEADRRLAAGEPTLALAAAARALDVLAAGRLLADEPYVAWAEQAEADRTSLVRRGRHLAAQAGVACDDAAAAVTFAGAAVSDDPWDEAGHRLLMTAHARAGEPARALGVYTMLRDLLDRELGVEPAPATRELYVAILREDAGGADEAMAPTTGGPAGDARAHQSAAESGPRLTGREAEMAQLNAAWAAAADSRPQLVLLVGEAGIGKTRLAAEVAAVAAATGGVVLHVRCYEAERGLFLQPVVEALGPVLGSLAAGELRRVAGESAPALAVLIPSLDPLLRPEPIARGAPDLERRKAFDAVTDVVGRLSVRGPVLLLLDDLHNAGRATVELLHYMSRRLGSSRVLALATIRREEGQEALAALDPVAAVIDVQALSPDAVAELAASYGQTHLAELILGRTRGHTLFVIETLGALASGRDGIPDSLQAAVLARVHRTGRDTEVLLRAAAVLGATLDTGHLAGMLDVSPREVLDRCEQALAARLLVVADRDFEFANDLVREVLYDSTPPPIRLGWHRQAADLLADHPEALAVHASAAHDWSRAARAWLLAAEEAMRRFAAADAEVLLTRAIGAAVQAADVEVTARAHVVRGRAREARSEFDLAYADLHTAAGLAREAGDHRVEMIALRQLAGDVPVALGLSVAQSADYLERGLQLAEALGETRGDLGQSAALHREPATGSPGCRDRSRRPRRSCARRGAGRAEDRIRLSWRGRRAFPGD